MHAGCPVLKGEKYSATVWIHVKPFRQGLLSPISGGQEGCVDHNDNCGQWAENGECEKNPEYMVGRSGFPGYCMKSCGVCPPS